MQNERAEAAVGDSAKNAVVLDMVFCGAEVSVDDILKKHRITHAEYAKWLNDDEYLSHIRELSSRGAEAEMARVLKSLICFAKKGNVPAAKAVDGLLKERLPEEAAGANDFSAIAAEFEKLDREIFGDEAVT